MDDIKYTLSDAAKHLMQTEDLEKISVAAICRQAGVSRQSFYRNFQDKFDLVNWCFEKLAEKSFKQMGVSCTLKEGLVMKFTFLQKEKAFFTQAFKSDDVNSLKEYDYQCILQFYTDKIENKLKHKMDRQTAFTLKMYCAGSITMTVDWVNKGMKTSPEEMADLLVGALPHSLEELLCEF